MLDFFRFGEYFINAISDIGDFLLSKPFDVDFWHTYSFLLSKKAQLRIAMDAEAFTDLSVGMVIFGIGLVGLLTFKLIKFFLGIVTGS